MRRTERWLAVAIACVAAGIPSDARAVPQLTCLDAGAHDGIAIDQAGEVLGIDPSAWWDVSGGVHDLGTIAVAAINDAGDIVGSTAPGSGNAVLWRAGVVVDLGTLGGNWSSAVAINDAGQVAGNSETGSGAVHAFSWSAGVITDLETLGGPESRAIGIDAAGRVAGTSTTATGESHAFLWSRGVMLDLGTLGGTWSRAVAIHSGRVVGESTTADGNTHAFLWAAGTMMDLGTLGGATSSATDVNSAGQVVGYATNDAGFPHGFLWDSGEMHDLGVLPTSGITGSSFASVVNEFSEVAGYSLIQLMLGAAAFLWDADGIHSLGGGLQCLPSGINDFGQVVAWCFGASVRGCAALADVPPSQKAERLRAFFERSVADATLVGTGSLHAAPRRLAAFGHMLRSAEALVAAGHTVEACGLLREASLKVDGASSPGDFVAGPAALQVGAMIRGVRGAIRCK